MPGKSSLSQTNIVSRRARKGAGKYFSFLRARAPGIPLRAALGVSPVHVQVAQATHDPAFCPRGLGGEAGRSGMTGVRRTTPACTPVCTLQVMRGDGDDR